MIINSEPDIFVIPHHLLSMRYNISALALSCSYDVLIILQESYQAVKECNANACPNASFLTQLEKWYTETIGSVTSEA